MSLATKYRPKEFSDVEHYLKRQKRFKHLTEEDIRYTAQCILDYPGFNR